MPQEDITHAVDGGARERLEQAKLEKQTKPCSPQDKDPMSVGPQRTEPDGSPSTRMIPKRKAAS